MDPFSLVASMWRIEYEDAPLTFFSSGTVLCLGRPSDLTCRVVCFQNFQMPLFDKMLKLILSKNKTGRTFINGGFVLPAEIRATKILCEEYPDHAPIYSGGSSLAPPGGLLLPKGS
jgi:hypothetical protein